MNLHKKVTQKDIAERLGVTQMTVSRALRGKGSMTDETRQRIIDTATEMGYRFNVSALSIREGYYGNIVLLCDDNKAYDIIDPDFLFTCMRALRDRDFSMSFTSVPGKRFASERFFADTLREMMADGILMSYLGPLPDHVKPVFERFRMPLIWANSKHEHDCVYFDDLNSARTATEHLIAQGYTRIAYINYAESTAVDPYYYHYSFFDRKRGYLEAMDAAGLTPMPLIASKHLDNAARRQHATTFLSKPDRPTALLCYSAVADVLPWYTAGYEQGLRIPDDLAVLAYSKGDAPGGLPIKTLQFDYEALGTNCIDMLWQKIEEPQQSLSPIEIPFEIRDPG